MTIRSTDQTPVVSQSRTANQAGTVPAKAEAAKTRIETADALQAAAPTQDAASLKAAIGKLVAGATFDGGWTASQLQQVLEAVTKVPVAQRKALAGTAFVLNPGGELPGNAVAYARNNPRSVTFQPAGFDLPKNAQGIPQAQELAMHEFAHLIDKDPSHSQEFAKLSGWQETELGPDGSITRAAHDANGIDRTGHWAEGNQTYPDGSRMAYSYAKDAKFVAGDEATSDPRDDYAESYRTYVFRPEELMAVAPEKFLFINAEAKRFTPAQVARMAKAKGVDLEEVLTNLVVDQRAYQPTIDRLAAAHQISPNQVKLRANDHALLNKSVNVQGIVDRLAAEAVVYGPISTAKIENAARLRDAHHALVAAKADGPVIDEALVAFREQPLEAQLRADPKLALGNTWFQLSQNMRTRLAKPEYVTSLVGRAFKQLDLREGAGSWRATSPKDQAFDAILSRLFEPGRAGFAFRSQLGGLNGTPQDPRAALEKEGVWDQLPADQQAWFVAPTSAAKLKAMVSNPELVDSVFLVKEQGLGANRLEVALLKERGRDHDATPNFGEAFDTALTTIKAVRQGMVGPFGGSHLQLLMTDLNFQIQSGNLDFVTRFTASDAPGATAQDRNQAMSNLLGAWMWDALSPAEQKMLLSVDYRRHVAKEAESRISTGHSLTESFEVFGVQTKSLQQAFTLMADAGPRGQAFRTAFAADPTAALRAKGLLDGMPASIKQALAAGDAGVKAKLKAAMSAFEDAGKQATDAASKANLAAAIKGLTGDDHEMVTGALSGTAEDTRTAVADALKRATETGEFVPQGGNGGGS